jgi:hypothetical protein|tara:strand:- start:732 stop:920 length:189 start_codon:yes stop_codon:yes gene_type:complete
MIELRKVKKGDYVKRKVESKKVYIRGDYDKGTKSFSLSDTDDIWGREIFLKASTMVVIGFDY